MPDRELISGDRQAEDAQFEVGLRPRRLADFTGQSKLKENLSIAIEAARMRGEAMDHVLLYGPPGLGKTTLAYILTRKFAVGAEYREKPHNLSVDDERAAWDVFAAWTASRNISIVGAYVSLGSILAPVTKQSRDQHGAYLSLQVGF